MYHLYPRDNHPGPLRHRPVLSSTEPSAHLMPGAFSFLIRVSGGVGHGTAPARASALASASSVRSINARIAGSEPEFIRERKKAKRARRSLADVVSFR